MHGLSDPSFLTKDCPTARDMSDSQEVLDVFFHVLLLGAREVIQPATRERRSRLKLDSSLVRSMRRQRWGVVLTE